MNNRFKALAGLLVVCAAFASGPSEASVRVVKVCGKLPDFPGRTFPHCFSGGAGNECLVGIRGEYVDLTNEVIDHDGAHRFRIIKTGVGSETGDCVPPIAAGKTREGYVVLSHSDIQYPGNFRMVLRRPSVTDAGEDRFELPVRAGAFYVATAEPMTATRGVTERLTIRGRNLQHLVLKEPVTEGDAITDVDPDGRRARLRLTFTEPSGGDLSSKLQWGVFRDTAFDAIPWPRIRVSEPARVATPQLVPGAAPNTPAVGGLQPIPAPAQRPNLTPVLLNSTNKLLHDIGARKSNITMIDPSFCSRLGDNQSLEMSLPDIEWGVLNDNASAITTPFTIELLGGGESGALFTTSKTPQPISTQQLTGLARTGRRTFRNWPGRPNRIVVQKVTSEPLLTEYGNTAGCYIKNGFSVTMDPDPLIIRVDTTNAIEERVESDNERNID